MSDVGGPRCHDLTVTIESNSGTLTIEGNLRALARVVCLIGDGRC